MWFLMLLSGCAACRPMQGCVLAFTMTGTFSLHWGRPRKGCLQLSISRGGTHGSHRLLGIVMMLLPWPSSSARQPPV